MLNGFAFGMAVEVIGVHASAVAGVSISTCGRKQSHHAGLIGCSTVEGVEVVESI